jgi:hypothetical protein
MIFMEPPLREVTLCANSRPVGAVELSMKRPTRPMDHERILAFCILHDDVIHFEREQIHPIATCDFEGCTGARINGQPSPNRAPRSVR